MHASDILEIYNASTKALGPKAAAAVMKGFDKSARRLPLQGYWPLNELPGQALDLSRYSNDAENIQEVMQGKPGLCGSTDNAADCGYEFNGTSHALNFSGGALGSAIHRMGTGDFTLFAWIKTSADLTHGHPQTIFASNRIGTPYTPQIGLVIMAGPSVQGAALGGKLYFYMSDGTGTPDVASDNVLLADGQAHFIVARRSAGVMSLMIDGVNQADTQASSVAILDAGPRATCLGANYMTSNYSGFFQGTLQKVGISTNVSISDAQLLRLYFDGVGETAPVFHMRLNETSGTVAINSAGPNAIYAGSPTLAEADSPFVHEPGAVSVKLNGSTDYIDTGITDAAALAGVGAKLSVAIWFKTSASSAGGLITKGFWGGETQQEMHINGDGGLAVNIFNAAQVGANTNTNNGVGGAFNDGQWHHVAVTLDTAGDGLTRIYVDSVLNTTTTTVLADIRAGTGKLLIGATDNNGTVEMFFNGHLADARLYNVALSALEIKNLYNAASLP